MADKPRVKAPRQAKAQPQVKAPRQRGTGSGADHRRTIVILAGGGAAVLVAVAVTLAFLGISGGGSSNVRATLEAAGCTLRSYPGVSRIHIPDANARPKSWNSFPPTSGPHYPVPAVYGFYDRPLQLARVLHNLEHGGIYMLYGSDVPADTPEKLRQVYDQDPRGLVVAPLPELGKTIALGAWTSQHPGTADLGTGHLAKCTQVNEKAFDAFIKTYRAHGPQGFPLNALQPGGV
jgi:hypothetical protein